MNTLLPNDEQKKLREIRFDYKNQIKFFLKLLNIIEKNYFFFYKKNLRKLKTKKVNFFLFYFISVLNKIFKFYYFNLNMKKIELMLNFNSCYEIFTTFFLNKINKTIYSNYSLRFIKKHVFFKT
jgi:hypothetical protein